MYNNPNNPNPAAPARGAGRKEPRQPKPNEWQGVGIVKPRSTNDQEEIKFYPFQNGGGAIHIIIACSETYEKDGQSRVSTTYIPVNITTNSRITEPQLRAIRSGVKVRVVGKLKPETYNKRSGERVTTLVVDAFVLEILEGIAPNPQPYYGESPVPQGQPAPAYGGYPAQQGWPAQGMPPQGAPSPQPYYNPYAPQQGWPAQGAPVQQPYYGGYAPQQPYPQPAPAPAHGGAPAYAPQGAPAPAPAPAATAAPADGRPMRAAAPVQGTIIDDLPPDSTQVAI